MEYYGQFWVGQDFTGTYLTFLEKTTELNVASRLLLWYSEIQVIVLKLSWNHQNEKQNYFCLMETRFDTLRVQQVLE